MPVSEMRLRMTNTEFVYWQAFHGRKAQRVELEQKKAARKGR